MLLAYVNIGEAGQDHPQLCLVADKPDTFSIPVRVDSLITTACAVHRLGPLESILVQRNDYDGSLVIEPMTPAKLYVTPNDPQYPGVAVKCIKIIRLQDGGHQVGFLQHQDQGDQWREWCPLREKV